MMKIIHNRIKCNKCGDVIESNSVHEFVTCSCGACSVDGGHEYLRRLGWQDDWTDMSEVKEVPDPDPKEVWTSGYLEVEGIDDQKEIDRVITTAESRKRK